MHIDVSYFILIQMAIRERKVIYTGKKLFDIEKKK